ncbi:hypothetical protein A1O1_05663 [Capronia coronata CBS 617.96]|uniref:Uncharacterized protein n=1 Tax=Capronia coronata CBS 617.96 TaxID=1182541 RepID=W9YHI6_9EURO|nr:uncharacterized protein A1O1_05663 [Capronia coronata CBS 617.96]EXJ88731.1 hypothetical protein A1O1_05663 [Capronia coronata CBS 617.96]
MGAARDLWLRWKMLRLPWRKKFLIGQDLHGNTFWEFKDTLNPGRWRRIVKADRRTHFSDVQVSPQWHQWLRQTRADAPTLQEQAADLQRQALLKQNARLADARWAAKARYIEEPKPASTSSLPGDPVTDRPSAESIQRQAPTSPKSKSTVETPTPFPKEAPAKTPKDAGANPGAAWQPQAWAPGPAKR